MKPKVVIWGARGHGIVVADILKRGGVYEPVAFLDTVNEGSPGLTVAGLPVFKSFPDLRNANPDVTHLTFGFGNCQAKIDLLPQVKKEGFAFATAIHPSAILADVEIGEGAVIAAGAIINCHATIGSNVIVNTGATVDHECVIEQAVHICPGVHLAGNVQVGKAAWVGIGTIVTEKIKIGSGSIIGAGSLVIGDIPDGVVAFGSPAKVRRKA